MSQLLVNLMLLVTVTLIVAHGSGASSENWNGINEIEGSDSQAHSRSSQESHESHPHKSHSDDSRSHESHISHRSHSRGSHKSHSDGRHSDESRSHESNSHLSPKSPSRTGSPKYHSPESHHSHSHGSPRSHSHGSHSDESWSPDSHSHRSDESRSRESPEWKDEAPNPSQWLVPPPWVSCPSYTYHLQCEPGVKKNCVNDSDCGYSQKCCPIVGGGVKGRPATCCRSTRHPSWWWPTNPPPPAPCPLATTPQYTTPKWSYAAAPGPAPVFVGK